MKRGHPQVKPQDNVVTMTEEQYLFAQDMTRIRIAEQVLREIVSVDVKYIVSLISELSCAFYRDLQLEEDTTHAE